MGSGETAPAMVKIHRRVLADLGPGSLAMLDTPYGFQDNADLLTARTLDYFRESIGVTVQVASWRRGGATSGQREAALATMIQASWLFAGPGSPTYALRQWSDTPVPAAMADLMARGGTIVLGSAAAVTAGALALPVYEIYKVGCEPYWEAGLDLLRPLLGASVAVIPHYDNAEGGTYDTRFCYLGEQRLAIMESQLPPDGVILGIDEHTAVLLDHDTQTIEVAGIGALTVRRGGRSQRLPAGTTLPLAEFADAIREVRPDDPLRAQPPIEQAQPPRPDPASGGQPSLDSDISSCRQAFDEAITAKDVGGCTAALLELETALHAWSADTLQSDAMDRGRRELRAMVVRLGELAQAGVQDPAQQLAPLVSILLDLRARARASKDFESGDLIRDQLAAAGIEVRDSPDGTAWQLA